MSESFSLAEMLPVINEALKDGGCFTFIPRGSSMEPLLRGGRDSVTIESPHGRLKKYDLPLYRRENGDFVLHRVLKVLPDGYVVRGDSQSFREKINDGQIVAVVSSYTRKGTNHGSDSLYNRIYCDLIIRFDLIRRAAVHFSGKGGKKT